MAKKVKEEEVKEIKKGIPMEAQAPVKEYGTGKKKEFSIIELKAYLDSCIVLINHYHDQYEMSRDEGSAKLQTKYTAIYYKVKDEIEKKVNEVWEK